MEEMNVNWKCKEKKRDRTNELLKEQKNVYKKFKKKRYSNPTPGPLSRAGIRIPFQQIKRVKK